MTVHCAHTQLVDPRKLKPNPVNPNRHSAHQIQILAAIMPFALLTMFFLAGFLVYVGPLPWMREHTGYISAVLHMYDFTKGVIDTRPAVFYLSSTAWLLFAAVKAVEARRWK